MYSPCCTVPVLFFTALLFTYSTVFYCLYCFELSSCCSALCCSCAVHCTCTVYIRYCSRFLLYCSISFLYGTVNVPVLYFSVLYVTVLFMFLLFTVLFLFCYVLCLCVPVWIKSIDFCNSCYSVCDWVFRVISRVAKVPFLSDE